MFNVQSLENMFYKVEGKPKQEFSRNMLVKLKKATQRCGFKDEISLSV